MSQEKTRENAIKAIDAHSIHHITSGQVVSDLQTAVKELVENSLDAKATSIEVRFKDYGLKSIEVIDNGTGIAPEDYDSVGLKHHTSKLASFEDLTKIVSFGFRGEALSSLCALTESVVVTTSTQLQAPMGTILELDRNGHVKSRNKKVARQRGTTVAVNGLFKPLPVRRKELERNAKREFGKALNLLNAYALVPCTKENQGVRLTVSNQPEGSRKTTQLQTDGSTSLRSAVTSLWGPKSLENVVELDLEFGVETEKTVLRRRGLDRDSASNNTVRVRGLISKFAVGCGRTGSDRQFFFINGRPCAPTKVQKAFNEVYKTFNMNQLPFIIADFIIPTDSCDINVSPDKRTILLHSENNLIDALKRSLTEAFASARSTFALNATQGSQKVGAPGRKDSRNSEVSADEAPAPAEIDAGTTPEHFNAASQQTLSDDSQSPFGAPSTSNSAIRAPSTPANEHAHGAVRLVPTPADTIHPASPPVTSSVPHAPPADPDQGPSRLPSPRTDGIEEDVRVRTEEPLDENVASAGASKAGLDDAQGPSEPGSEKSGSASRASSVSRPRAPGMANGRTPATVERILGADEGSAGSTRQRSVQMVLDTSGASWNLKRGPSSGSGAGGQPRKKARVESEGAGKAGRGNEAKVGSRSGVGARESLREQLKGFASQGTRPSFGKGEQEGDDDKEDEDEDETGGTEEDVEMVEAGKSGDESTEPVKPPGKRIDENAMDVNEADYSTDVIDETMDVDSAPAETSDHEIIDLTDDALASGDKSSSIVAETSHASSDYIRPPEVIRTAAEDARSAHFDLSHVTDAWRGLHKRVRAATTAPPPTAVLALKKKAGIAGASDDVDEVLSRVLHKKDFETMEVVGQFNLGFIIARRRTEDTDDLFIVDQHAADEKYNFETLQQTTKIESQRLYSPLELELTAADVLVAAENIDVLKQNGFEVVIDESEDAEDDRKVKLVAQPVSKSTVFDVKDLEELLHLLQDLPAGTMVRCSKARAMFAMRACRMSIMVGKALNTKQMTTVIRHMGTMDQPWNCPHGRPTMRHLSDVNAASPKRERKIAWAKFGMA